MKKEILIEKLNKERKNKAPVQVENAFQQFSDAMMEVQSKKYPTIPEFVCIERYPNAIVL